MEMCALLMFVITLLLWMLILLCILKPEFPEQELLGVDFLTFMSMGSELAQTGQDWMQDPSQWWDAQTGSVNVTGIPGLSPTDSAARLGDFNDALTQWQLDQNTRQSQLPQELYSRFLEGNPFPERTAEGQRLGRYGQAAGVAAGAPVQQPVDQSFALQYAMLPDLINQYVRQGVG